LTVTGVVCALRSEARHLGRTVSRDAAVETLADGKLLAVTGMGGTAAAAGAEALVGAGAAALLSFGLAGALDPQLHAGQIFLPSEITSVGGAFFSSDASWRERLGASLAALDLLDSGRLISAVEVLPSARSKAALYAASGARAVDMESAAVAAAAARHGLPFLALRVIFDRAADELPAAVLLATDAGGEIALRRLLGQLLRSPAQWVAVLRLARRFRLASRALAAVARSGALEPPDTPRPAGARSGVT
jgi:adenosylhomocysteine nucleosidase